MARQMLQLYPNTYALVVSTENITQNRCALGGGGGGLLGRVCECACFDCGRIPCLEPLQLAA